MKEISKYDFKLIEKSLNDMAKAFSKADELKKAEKKQSGHTTPERQLTDTREPKTHGTLKES